MSFESVRRQPVKSTVQPVVLHRDVLALLRSSGLRAAADDLGRGQKLRAAAGQRGKCPEFFAHLVWAKRRPALA
jgi:hypothetical protein